jgi:serine/threonine-protein kinase RsbW
MVPLSVWSLACSWLGRTVGNAGISENPDLETQAMLGPDQFPDTREFRVRKLVFRLDKVIPSDPTLLDGAVEEITAGLSRTTHWRDAEDIGLAVGEALANAIIHGNRCDPEKPVHVVVAVNEHGDLLVSVKDLGSGFDPSRLPNPTAPENRLAPNGRGIFLIRQLMDEVDFKFNHGTELCMRRKKK